MTQHIPKMVALPILVNICSDFNITVGATFFPRKVMFLNSMWNSGVRCVGVVHATFPEFFMNIA